MEQARQADFTPHCDDPACDLGRVMFNCPECNGWVSDYDLWWEQDKIQSGTPVVFSCDRCQQPLRIEWNPNEFEYTVSKI